MNSQKCRLAFLVITLLMSCSYSAIAKPITKMRILTDQEAIKTYITKTQADIAKGKWWGKLAASGAGISNKAFDAMPVEKFEDAYQRSHKIDPKRAVGKLSDEKALKYINEGKNEFMEKHFDPKRTGNGRKSDLAEFLHDRMVDHLNISDKESAKAKKEPLILHHLLESGTVEEELYEELTCRNMAINYYVEKEADQK